MPTTLIDRKTGNLAIKSKLGNKLLVTKEKEDGLCVKCGRKLPAPVWENREGGYSELVTYCPCGNTYIS